MNIPNHYPENFNKLFTFLGGKFKLSAQDSDLEFLCWRCKKSPVSSDLKPPLEINRFHRIPVLNIPVGKNKSNNIC